MTVSGRGLVWKGEVNWICYLSVFTFPSKIPVWLLKPNRKTMLAEFNRIGISQYQKKKWERCVKLKIRHNGKAKPECNSEKKTMWPSVTEQGDFNLCA